MSGKSYSSKIDNNEFSSASPHAADHAAKKAEEEVEKIKREAHEQLTRGKESFHNPDDREA